MGITIRNKADGGFEIEITPMSVYQDVKKDIVEKLSKNSAFFTGTGAKLTITGKKLTHAQRNDLKSLLSKDYNIENVEFFGSLAEHASRAAIRQAAQPNTAAQPAKPKPQEAQPQPTPTSPTPASGRQVKLVSKDYFNAKSVFVSHTLRSGQRVECAGDVVVLGDVNDGAEVIAGGSIAVMGTLRGLVHAGATGRRDVVVAANALQPKQLRISGKIAVFSENRRASEAEIAEFKEGSVVVRPLKSQGRPLNK